MFDVSSSAKLSVSALAERKIASARPRKYGLLLRAEEEMLLYGQALARTTRSEIEVALRSSRTRTTVPSRIRRTIGSSASERVFQASQSLFTLRHVRLTVSLPTVPPNNAANARRTRLVLVPAR